MTQPMPTHVVDPEPARDAHDVLAELAAVADDRPDWQERGLCAQTDPEAFFPEKGGSTSEAKRICQGCEVRAECLEYALEHDERFGIWGGLSERERRRLKPDLLDQLPVRVVVPEQRQPETSRSSAPVDGAGRESAPAPGGGRHAGGAGLATTLPTEPRYPRGHGPQTTKPSTFPERARTTTTPADDAPRATADRPRRARRTGAPSRPTRTRPAAAVPAPRTPASTETRPESATPADQTTASVTELHPTPAEGSGQQSAGQAATDDEAAASLPGPGRPPDDPVLTAVLAAQAAQPGATSADPAIVDALAAGDPVPAASEWEVAFAAVIGVQRGQTRGQMARRLGADSRDVAHRYRRWLEDMPLIEPHRDGSPDGTDRHPRPDVAASTGGHR